MAINVREEILNEAGGVWLAIRHPQNNNNVLLKILKIKYQKYFRDALEELHLCWVNNESGPPSMRADEVLVSRGKIVLPQPDAANPNHNFPRLIEQFVMTAIWPIEVVHANARGEYHHFLRNLCAVSTAEQFIGLWYHPFIQSVNERVHFPKDFISGMKHSTIFRRPWSQEYVNWEMLRNAWVNNTNYYHLKRRSTRYGETAAIYTYNDIRNSFGVVVANRIKDNCYGEIKFARQIAEHPVNTLPYEERFGILLDLFGVELAIKIFDFAWDKKIDIDFKKYLVRS